LGLEFGSSGAKWRKVARPLDRLEVKAEAQAKRVSPFGLSFSFGSGAHLHLVHAFAQRETVWSWPMGEKWAEMGQRAAIKSILPQLWPVSAT